MVRSMISDKPVYKHHKKAVFTYQWQFFSEVWTRHLVKSLDIQYSSLIICFGKFWQSTALIWVCETGVTLQNSLRAKSWLSLHPEELLLNEHTVNMSLWVKVLITGMRMLAGALSAHTDVSGLKPTPLQHSSSWSITSDPQHFSDNVLFSSTWTLDSPPGPTQHQEVDVSM